MRKMFELIETPRHRKREKHIIDDNEVLLQMCLSALERNQNIFLTHFLFYKRSLSVFNLNQENIKI